MRVEIELSNGKRVYVGGRPLMSAQELHRHYPELGKAIEDHDAIVEETQSIASDDMAAVERIYPRFEAAQYEICVQIIKLFNDIVDRKECLIDKDTYNTIISVWSGTYEKKT